jgi:hypothetical protein
MTPAEFKTKWAKFSGKESAAYQEHFNDLCRMLGVATPIELVCQLKDRRVLAVEYKGQHLYDGNDAGEKRGVGAVWAARSGGRCLFARPTNGDFSAITTAMK